MAKDGFFSRIFKRKKTKVRRYEAASKAPRLKGWHANNASSNSVLARDIKTLKARSRELIRNNATAAKAKMTITSNVIGHGVKTKFEGPGAERIQDLWNEWAESTECDFDGTHNLYGLQRIVMDATFESGEVLARKKTVSKNKVPLQYQILESDFIADEALSTDKNKLVIQGVQCDKNGVVEGYHLYESHPGDYASFGYNSSLNTYSTNFFKKDEIHHIFRKDRPGQKRGAPWLHPIMVRLRDIDQFIDATIMKQKTAACFAGFVQDMSVELLDQDMLPESNEQISMNIEPGIIEELPPGKTITFSNPPSMEDYKEFHSTNMRAVAAGVGLSYESLTGDLSESNFSAGRMGWLEMSRNIDSWRNQVIIIGFVEKVVRDFISSVKLKGINTTNLKWRHIQPKREMIDPGKEIPAIIKKVRAGLTSLTEEITSMGKDPDKIMKQIAADNKLLDQLGIIVDSDPRKITIAGIKQLDETEGMNNE